MIDYENLEIPNFDDLKLKLRTLLLDNMNENDSNFSYNFDEQKIELTKNYETKCCNFTLINVLK